MTLEKFAALMGFSRSLWWQVLDGRRNLGWRNCKRVAKVIGGDPNLWRAGGTDKGRKKAWKKYQEKLKETA